MASSRYYQFGNLTFAEVKALVSQPKSVVDHEGMPLRVSHARLQTFTQNGCVCVACKRVADTFVIECSIYDQAFKQWYFNPLDNPIPQAHINLYGVDPVTGDEFMMTSDHIIPHSLGGSNKIKNRVPLCERCNQLKGNDVDWLTDLPKDRRGNLIHRKNKQVAGKAKPKERQDA